MDTYVLDLATWRSGSENNWGTGKSVLLNLDGFSCCLGQWCSQAGASDDELLLKAMPGELESVYDEHLSVYSEEIGTYEDIEDRESIPTVENSELAATCATINDLENMPPREKIEKLQELLSKEDIELVVENEWMLDVTDWCYAPDYDRGTLPEWRT